MGLHVVQGLDPEPVAGDEERPSLPVPQREGEHPAQPMDAIFPELLVQVNDDFSVGTAVKCVAPLEQLLRKRAAVVDLPIEDDLKGSVLIVDRLLSGLEIDDAEPSHAEAHASVEKEPLIVGAAVSNGVAHG